MIESSHASGCERNARQADFVDDNECNHTVTLVVAISGKTTVRDKRPTRHLEKRCGTILLLNP